ncbi:hypothetical protein PSC71_13165 [Devosia sp. J2-20]|uniref:hypothetical protein n=1 Tax=Devosia sp. J2-20 TaxID=3026161 RepID=UPI00249AD4CA|nr:hypothetical protein [Devosia sp. J2-20]WDQ98178.1 hypothetical protein PSC71_13165 [Devosia sp. J2-20]
MSIDDQIAELEEILSSGVSKVVTQSQGVRTEAEYQSMDAMQRRLDKLKAQKARRSRTSLVAF